VDSIEVRERPRCNRRGTRAVVKLLQVATHRGVVRSGNTDATERQHESDVERRFRHNVLRIERSGAFAISSSDRHQRQDSVNSG